MQSALDWCSLCNVSVQLLIDVKDVLLAMSSTSLDKLTVAQVAIGCTSYKYLTALWLGPLFVCIMDWMQLVGLAIDSR